MRDIAAATGFSYDDLVSGSYKILLEPMAYFKYSGVMFAVTATEAALYNKQVAGGLRSKMVSLTHKNLPLAMFLETPDLGFPAWGGSTTDKQNDDVIIAQLGLGIVRFSEPDPEPPKESDVTYRCDTEVITSVLLSTGSQKTPDSPAYAHFSINGRTYSHTDIYIPEDGSQLAWVKWRTPKEPGIITIRSNCSTSTNSITAQIVDLDKNPPPDPQANDRNDGFSIPAKPNKPNVTSLTWGEWDCWWHEYWVWHSGDDDDDGYWCDHGWGVGVRMDSVFSQPDCRIPDQTGRKEPYRIRQADEKRIWAERQRVSTGALQRTQQSDYRASKCGCLLP